MSFHDLCQICMLHITLPTQYFPSNFYILLTFTYNFALLNYSFLWTYAQGGIAGSYGSSIFSFFEEPSQCFPGLTSLRSHQQCRRVPISLHLLQHLLVVDFLMVDILTSVKCYLIAVLICISLTVSNIEHLFMCLLAICMSLKKCLLTSSPHFQFELFVVCYWITWAVYIFWRLSLCQLHCLQIFSPIWYIVFSFCLWFPLLCKHF